MSRDKNRSNRQIIIIVKQADRVIQKTEGIVNSDTKHGKELEVTTYNFREGVVLAIF